MLDECAIERDVHRGYRDQFKKDLGESFFVNFLQVLFGAP